MMTLEQIRQRNKAENAAARRLQALTDDKCLSRLTNAVYQQRLVAALDPAHNILFDFPFQHHQHLHAHSVHFSEILYHYFDIFSRRTDI